MKKILLLAAGFIIFHIVLSIVSPLFLPFYGNFSHASLLEVFQFPVWLERFSYFDGLHYVNIAKQYYLLNSYAFFPLFPLLIRATSFFVGDLFIAGLIVTWIFFIGTVALFPKFMDHFDIPKKNHALWALLLFPTSFFLVTLYTESLFIYLILLSFLFVAKKQYIFALVPAFLIGMTRIVGVFSSFIFLGLLLDQIPKKTLRAQLSSLDAKKVLIVLAPLLGLLSYMLYLYMTTGDALRFFHEQETFGNARSTELILFPQVMYRYLKIFFSADWSIVYFVALIEFILFSFALTILGIELKNLLYDRYGRRSLSRLGIHMYGWCSLLLPALTGTFLSIPRFLLPIFSIYLVFGEIRNRLAKLLLLSIFFVLHIILSILFFRGYFVS